MDRFSSLNWNGICIRFASSDITMAISASSKQQHYCTQCNLVQKHFSRLLLCIFAMQCDQITKVGSFCNSKHQRTVLDCNFRPVGPTAREDFRRARHVYWPIFAFSISSFPLIPVRNESPYNYLRLAK